MGVQTVNTVDGGEGDRLAMQRVLRDLDALERMLEEDLFETDRRRIGCEQELFLIDDKLQPAAVATDVLEIIDDPRVVPELARFNLEYNCDPVEIGSDCLRSLESQLSNIYSKVDNACRAVGARATMAGICPTVDLSHLTKQNIMPHPRYHVLDEALRRLRGDDYELRIDGADELTVRHPSVMLESVNTSFQVHYQTTPSEFAAAYNVALGVAAPVLASSVYSPILFGKRLWNETRIAIFQQVVDTRSEGAGLRDFLGRVRFGESWVNSSVLEVLRSDLARFRQILHATSDNLPDPMKELDAGRVPKLSAWQAFNSTVYRWMRPCFGVTDGKPHLRIENRVLPSGPTIADEVANAAFWIGLMAEGPYVWSDLSKQLEFRDARGNFLRAARDGLAAQMIWINGEEHPIGDLIVQEFLPVARKGLARCGIDADDIVRNIGIIEDRVTSRKTGAKWMLRTVAQMRGSGTRRSRLTGLARAMLQNQDSGQPVHTWEEADISFDEPPVHEFARVAQCMTTDLFTVGEHDCIDLVASIMDWEHVRHIPVEDSQHRLIGIVSYRKLLRMLAKRHSDRDTHLIAVSEIMVRNPMTVTPDTPTLKAIRIMREHRVACLPVVENDRLVGIISDRDYTEIARTLLENALAEGPGS